MQLPHYTYYMEHVNISRSHISVYHHDNARKTHARDTVSLTLRKKLDLFIFLKTMKFSKRILK